MRYQAQFNFRELAPQPDLLNPYEVDFEDPPKFEATLNAHGVYETMRFVLRLSPRNHELVDSLSNGIYSVGEISSEAMQAYSTYIHETVHWWQHVGSTSGLLLSLSYLGQTHGNLSELRSVVAEFGPKKSLKRWADNVLRQEGESAQGKLTDANIAVNNALDVEYYRRYAFSPRKIAPYLIEQPHFESVGHGYHIAYGQLLGMLSAAFDPGFEWLPKGQKWEREFARLSQEQYEGFYYGSPIRLPVAGLHAIYEGQARFVQLQFLNSIYEKTPTCQEWRSLGYLSGIYVEAFEKFLELSQSEWPETIDDSIVSLFLLICDLAINPTRGFPLDIESFEDFILDVDVGVRFTRLSLAVAKQPELRGAIKDHSREEYISVANDLCRLTEYDQPLPALQKIAAWVDDSASLKALMLEQASFDYERANLPIRVFFSHYIAFTKDKLSHPEFFCWPGIWMAGGPIDEEKTKIWAKNLSLFSDKGDRPGVYPRKWPGRDEVLVQRMFENFYGSMAVYDFTHQWILRDGPFIYDYEWMMSNYSLERVKAWVDDTFIQVYGIKPDDFEILPASGK